MTEAPKKRGRKPKAEAPQVEAAPEKNKGGRPTVYEERFCDELIEFFSQEPTREVTVKDAKGNERTEILPGKFPTLARFAAMIGVHRDTLHSWATEKNPDQTHKNPRFSDAYKKAKDLQEANLVEGTMAGAYNSTFAIFTAKNVLGWRDKTEQEITGKDGAPFTGIEVIFRNPDGTNSDPTNS